MNSYSCSGCEIWMDGFLVGKGWLVIAEREKFEQYDQVCCVIEGGLGSCLVYLPTQMTTGMERFSPITLRMPPPLYGRLQGRLQASLTEMRRFAPSFSSSHPIISIHQVEIAKFLKAQEIIR